MKKVSAIFLSIIGLLIMFTPSCKKGDKKDLSKTIFADTVEYTCGIYNPELNSDYNLWMFENIETSYRSTFVKELLKKVYEGKVPVYSTESEKPLTVQEIENRYTIVDSVYLPSSLDPNEDTLILNKTKIQAENITKIKFREVWDIDTASGLINKRVIEFALIEDCYIINPMTGEKILKGWKELFWIKNNDVKDENLKTLSPLYVYNHITTKDTSLEMPSSFFWSEQMTDITKNGLRNLLYHTSLKDTSKIWSDYVERVKEKKAIENAYLKEFKQEYTSVLGETIVDKRKLPDAINDFSFVEEWYYDANTFSLKKKVKAIAPIIIVTTPDIKTDKNIFKGFNMPFYLSLN